MGERRIRGKVCEVRGGARRSRSGEEEGKTRALGKDGVGGGREKEVEERKRKGRGDLFVVPRTSHSGVIKKQERKEMCPGLGTGVQAQWTPHPVGPTVPHFHWPQAAPPQMEALALLFRLRPSSSQCLPSPVQPLAPLPFVLVPALPSQRATVGRPVSGSHPHPHPTASPGALRRIRKSVLSSGQTQLCARPHKAWEEELGLAISPLLSPRSPTLGDPGTHFQNLHPAPGSAIWPVSRSTPPPPCSHPELSSHPVPYHSPTEPLTKHLHHLNTSESLPGVSFSPLPPGELSLTPSITGSSYPRALLIPFF